MAITKIAVKYTDETYATHADLQRALHMSLISDFWKDVEEYRRAHQKKILLKTIGGLPLFYTATPSLEARYKTFTRKLERFAEAFEELEDMPRLREKIEKDFLFDTLSHASSISGLRVSESALKALVSGMYDAFGSVSDEASKTLCHYRDILKNIDHEEGRYSMDDLARDYGLLLGQEELTSFYREENSPSYRPSNFTGASRVYEEAPFEKIEELMDGMFTFQNVDACPRLFKAVAAGFYFVYIKPFHKYNELIACIASKAILGGKGNAYLPFEIPFSKTNRWAEISKETQLSGDLTYIILHVIEQMSSFMDMMLESIVESKRTDIEEEVYHAPPSKQERIEEEIEPEVEETEEIEADIEVLPQEEEAPMSLEIEQIREINEPSKSELALSAQKGGWSDKEIKDAAKFLLETHPLLRKQQALFFASHCTIGRYYSIQDYKKYAKCVYETARTSMDNLAREKLYKKLKIKNKYVYTPIKQGEPS